MREFGDIKIPKNLKAVLAGVTLILLAGIVLTWVLDFRVGRVDEPNDTRNDATDSRPTTPGADMDPSQRTLVVQIDGLNLRAGPSRATRSLKVLPKNTRVLLLNTEAGWHHVEHPDGVKGYVIANEEYVTLQ